MYISAIIIGFQLCFSSLCQTTVLDVAKELGAKTFLKFATDTGLIETLSGQGPFTLLVPTEDAFSNLRTELISDNDELKSVLLFHILNGKFSTIEFKDELRVESNYRNMKVRINQYENIFTIDGSKIVTADQIATNGIVHMIDKVLYPLPQQNILQFAASDTNFLSLTNAIVKSKLQDFLSGGPYTLFAPSNKAFSKLSKTILNDLLESEIALKEMLTYHTLDGTFYSVGLSNKVLPTIQGKSLNISKTLGEITINDALLTTPDIPVSNGVVHIIDTVLLPSY